MDLQARVRPTWDWMKHAFWIVGTVGALILPAFVGCRSDAERNIEQAGGKGRYVGRAICQPCHQEENRLWSGSHHDLAMQVATRETVLGDFDSTFTHQGVTSTFYRQDGKFLVRTEGPRGEPANYEIAFTFGAIPLQQYLVPFPGGRFQVLNIAWDSRPREEGGQRWFRLYPEAEIGPNHPLHWTRLSQTWNSACAECHSTNLVKGFDLESNSYQTSWTEIDISCEACHGPASRHVELAQGVAPDSVPNPEDWGILAGHWDSGRSWSFLPQAITSTRDPSPWDDAEIEICAPCHSRRATIGEGHLPGQPLFDSFQVSLLRPDLYYADGQIKDEVYVYGSLLQSKMYRAGVTCSDCHDPHSLRLRAEGNALCTRCHLKNHYDNSSHHHHPGSSKGAECVECHMPATIYMEVDDRRDHSLRIPQPHLTESVGSPNACTRCHSDRSAGWAAAAITSWGVPSRLQASYAEAIEAGRRQDPDGVAALQGVGQDPEQSAIVRGSALALLGSYFNRTFVETVRAGVKDSSPLVRLGGLQALQAWPPNTVLELAFPLLADPRRAIRIEAARVLASLPKSILTRQQAVAIEEGIQEYEQAQHVNADHPGSWVNLGNLHAIRADFEAAAKDYQRAVELDPTYLPGHLNLADFLRQTGRDDQAEKVLKEALRILPDSADLQHSRGLLLIRQGKGEEALQWLERAAVFSPERARFAYVYGVALGSAGELDKALRILESALANHPFDHDLLTALATFSRDRGDRGAAIQYAERLAKVVPGDAGIQQLLQELRGDR